MSLKTRHFFRIFIIMSLMYITVRCLSGILLWRESFSIYGLLSKTLFFGIFMGLFISNYHFWNLELLGLTEIKEEDLNPIQKRFCPSELSIFEVCDRMKSSLPEFKLVKKTSGNLDFKKNFNLNSWGEKVNIKACKQNDVFGFEISSRAPFWQLADGGRGLQNVLQINQLLSNTLSNA